jgi:hypothetical protein
VQRTELCFDHWPVESELVLQPHSVVEKQHTCSKCDKTFDKPKLVQYYACPHCMAKIEEEQKIGCQHWFGYLNEKAKDDPIPNECVECDKAVDCMLNQTCSSMTTAEIKKWYQ